MNKKLIAICLLLISNASQAIEIGAGAGLAIPSSLNSFDNKVKSGNAFKLGSDWTLGDSYQLGFFYSHLRFQSGQPIIHQGGVAASQLFAMGTLRPSIGIRLGAYHRSQSPLSELNGNGLFLGARVGLDYWLTTNLALGAEIVHDLGFPSHRTHYIDQTETVLLQLKTNLGSAKPRISAQKKTRFNTEIKIVINHSSLPPTEKLKLIQKRRKPSSTGPVWTSFKPLLVTLPVFEIGLIEQNGHRDAIYSCQAQSNSGCLLELSDSPKTAAILNSTVQSIAVGKTYQGAYIKTCNQGNQYFGKLNSEFVLEGQRYVTDSIGVHASETDSAADLNLPGSGCSREYSFPPIQINAESDKKLTLFIDYQDAAWAAKGGSIESSVAWNPEYCKGANGPNGAFVCFSYPDIGVILEEANQSGSQIRLEKFRLNDMANLNLFFKNDVPITGIMRPYYREGFSFSAAKTISMANTPLKTFSALANGAYKIQTHGDLQGSLPGFSTDSFLRKNHNGTYQSKSGAIQNYSAVFVSSGFFQSNGEPNCAQIAQSKLLLPVDPETASWIGGHGNHHSGDINSGHPEGHPGIDFTFDSQVDVIAPVSGIITQMTDISEIEEKQPPGTAFCSEITTDAGCQKIHLCHVRPLSGKTASAMLGSAVEAGETVFKTSSFSNSTLQFIHFGVEWNKIGHCPADVLDSEVVRCKLGLGKNLPEPANCNTVPLRSGGTLYKNSQDSGFVAHNIDVTCADGSKKTFQIPAEPKLCSDHLESELAAQIGNCLQLPSGRVVW